MRTLVAGLALTLQMFGSTAFAEVDRISGNFWQRLCASEGASQIHQCIGYLEGLSDGSLMWQEFGSSADFCPPDGVTLGQIRKVVLRYLEQHPHELHRPFAMLATFALRESFPCPYDQGIVTTESQPKR
jgi:Rap1a immunity proteins